MAFRRWADGDYVHDTHWLELQQGLQGQGIAVRPSMSLNAGGSRILKLNSSPLGVFIGGTRITRTWIGSSHSVSIANGNPTYARWDLWYLYDDSVNLITGLVQGTPGLVPVPPDLPANSITLALIWVPISDSGDLVDTNVFLSSMSADAWAKSLYSYDADSDGRIDKTVLATCVKLVGADYSTIQAAINASSDGDLIIVKAATYNENLTINKKIVLMGSGYVGTIVNGTILITVDGVRVSGISSGLITIQGASYCAIEYNYVPDGILLSSAANVCSFNTIRKNILLLGNISVIGLAGKIAASNIIEDNVLTFGYASLSYANYNFLAKNRIWSGFIDNFDYTVSPSSMVSIGGWTSAYRTVPGNSGGARFKSTQIPNEQAYGKKDWNMKLGTIITLNYWATTYFIVEGAAQGFAFNVGATTILYVGRTYSVAGNNWRCTATDLGNKTSTTLFSQGSYHSVKFEIKADGVHAYIDGTTPIFSGDPPLTAVTNFTQFRIVSAYGDELDVDNVVIKSTDSISLDVNTSKNVVLGNITSGLINNLGSGNELGHNIVE